MADNNLLIETCQHGIALITINRPAKLNALDRQTMTELDDAFQRIESDPACRALILTGAGEKAFVAGADLNDMVDLTPFEFQATCLRDQAIMRRVEALWKPSIAAINGYALGGGLELAMCCTMRVAATNAKLGQPEVKLGVIPGNGGTQRLPRLVGRGIALEMLTTGKVIGAEEAHRIGLVNHVVPQSELLEFCRGLLISILANGPLAVALVMQAVDVGLNCGIQEGLRFEATAQGVAASTQDRHEGARAFLEKRRPSFVGK